MALKDDHQFTPGNQQSAIVNGKEVWVPALPYPFFTTKGLPFWKRLNENNWRPECTCGRIFETLEDYYAHIVYLNSPYGGNL